MTKFYENWKLLEQKPHEALRQAQFWMRDTSYADKKDYFERLKTRYSYARDWYRRLELRQLSGEYVHPYYWAAFAYHGV